MNERTIWFKINHKIILIYVRLHDKTIYNDSIKINFKWLYIESEHLEDKDVAQTWKTSRKNKQKNNIFKSCLKPVTVSVRCQGIENWH